MIWFTSDSHFNHRNIITYCKRPYQSIEEMNAALVRNWNELVQPEDTVWYLGDFSLSKEAVATYLPQLQGEIHLIHGNHDHTHPAHHKNREGRASRMRDLYMGYGFKSIASKATIEIAGQQVLMHHMPYHGKNSDHSEKERYAEYRPTDDGSFLLCGHVHEKWAQKKKMINVGVDVRDYKPMPLSEVERIIRAYR